MLRRRQRALDWPEHPGFQASQGAATAPLPAAEKEAVETLGRADLVVVYDPPGLIGDDDGPAEPAPALVNGESPVAGAPPPVTLDPQPGNSGQGRGLDDRPGRGLAAGFTFAMQVPAALAAISLLARPAVKTVLGAIRLAADGADVGVSLAAFPAADGTWPAVLLARQTAARQAGRQVAAALAHAAGGAGRRAGLAHRLAAGRAGCDVSGALPAIAGGADGDTVDAHRAAADGAGLDAARPAHVPSTAGTGIQAVGMDGVAPVAQRQAADRLIAVMAGQSLDLAGVQVAVELQAVPAMPGGQRQAVMGDRGEDDDATERRQIHAQAVALQFVGDFAGQVTLQVGAGGGVLGRVATIHFVGQAAVEGRQAQEILLQPRPDGRLQFGGAGVGLPAGHVAGAVQHAPQRLSCSLPLSGGGLG